MKDETVTYSEAFKMQVVREIGQGRFASMAQARRACGIRGKSTIRKWIVKYGAEELLPKRVRAETMDEIDELREAGKKIRDLEKAPADSRPDCCPERAFLETACGKMGTDREAFKKKGAAGPAEGLRRQGKERA